MHLSTNKDPSPGALIQRQLDAYNAKDPVAWLATYAVDARQLLLHGEVLAAGHEQMRSRITERFAEPDLQAELLSRIVMNNIVVDHELVTRNFPDGKGSIAMLCVYEVMDGLIQTASFAMGEKRFLLSAL